MPGKRWNLLLAIALSVTLLAGCGSDEPGGDSTGRVGRSYVYGALDGALASQHVQVFSPQPWHGETDGLLLLSGDTLLRLSETERNAAGTLIKGGHAVLVTSAKQSHIEALHALIGTPAALSLDRASSPYSSVEIYGFAQPNGLMRMIAAPPFPALDGPEPDASKQARAEFVAHWLLEQVRGAEPSARASRVTRSSGPAQLLSDLPSWQMTMNDVMPAYWSTCGTLTKPGPLRQCVNNVQAALSAWMVYSADAAADPAAGQPTDYFIMQLSGTINTAGCQNFYGDGDHATRIAAYWLRQANMSATAAPPGSAFSLDQLSILGAHYAPVATNPANTTTTGVSWSLTGIGTAGANSGGPSGNLAFGAGVSFSDSSTATYPALDTQVNIDATASNAASWTYDSWNFVHQSIEPANHACGGPGLNTAAALPPIIYGGTFSPLQSWIWAAQPAVRSQLTLGATPPTLPVTVDTSLLLGWTYYSRPAQTIQCPAAASLGNYYLQNTSVADIVGVAGSPSNGLNFDVSCGVTTNYGTIPLGPPGFFGQNNGPGNPGTPYPLKTWAVNVPFAPTVVPSPTLATLAPTSGSAGTLVTLTGSHLDVVATVNFGGTTLPNTHFSYTKDGTIQVAAPQGKRQDTVLVSVGNSAGISNALPFTYAP